MIPEFETPRLKLRGHRIDDFDACFAMWNDEGVTRFIGGRPFSREETWGRLLRYLGHWQAMGYGYWAIEEKASGHFMGEIGFADMKREIDPPLDGMPEAGWALGPWAQGNRFATEALRAALEWADEHFASDVRTCCMISPENKTSIRVAETCGYRAFARATYKGAPTFLYRR